MTRSNDESMMKGGIVSQVLEAPFWARTALINHGANNKMCWLLLFVGKQVTKHFGFRRRLFWAPKAPVRRRNDRPIRVCSVKCGLRCRRLAFGLSSASTCGAIQMIFGANLN
jgi:hypothetical protein